MLAVVNGVEFENFVFCFAWLRCAMLQHVRAVLAGLSGNRKVEFEESVFCSAGLGCAMLQHVRAVLAGLSGNRKKKTFLTALVGACLGAPGRA